MPMLRTYWKESWGMKLEEDSIGNSSKDTRLKAQVAYWKPGAWFKYACVDRTQPGWNTPNAGNRYRHKPESDY